MNPSDHDQEQNLRAFEDNGWQLQIPDFPPMSLPLDLIADYRDAILGGFAQWVWGSSSVEITKDGDGQLGRVLASNRDELLNKYATVAEWLDREGLFPDGEEAPIPYAEYFTRDFFSQRDELFPINDPTAGSGN